MQGMHGRLPHAAAAADHHNILVAQRRHQNLLWGKRRRGLEQPRIRAPETNSDGQRFPKIFSYG
jgi:hypothetical protein